jgi:hypothetical protein
MRHTTNERTKQRDERAFARIKNSWEREREKERERERGSLVHGLAASPVIAF